MEAAAASARACPLAMGAAGKLLHSLPPRILPCSPVWARIGSRWDYCCLVGKMWSSSRRRECGHAQGHGAINKGRACWSVQNSGEGLGKAASGTMQDWGAWLSPPSHGKVQDDGSGAVENKDPQFWAGLMPPVWFWLAPNNIIWGGSGGVLC